MSVAKKEVFSTIKYILFIIFLISSIILTYASQWATNSQSDFDEGTYFQTFYNTTGNFVQLNISEGFLLGNQTSKIFDSGKISSWNNISWTQDLPNPSYIFTVDGQADVWSSTDNGATWALTKDDYTGVDSNGATYMAWNSTKDLFILYNQDIWISKNLGYTWNKINDDYNGAEGQNGFVIIANLNDELFIIEGDQDVWKSTNSGTTWTKTVSNFNGGNGNIFGIGVNKSNYIFTVDNAADVWYSLDGITWTLVKDDYNGGNPNGATDMIIDKSNNIYILDNQDIWKSTDSGVTWSLASDDFNGGSSNNGKAIISDENNNLYIIDGSEDVYQSTDGGINWNIKVSNFNGGNGNVFGIAQFDIETNLTLYARSCNDPSCTGESWSGPYTNNTLTTLSESNNRYFQYKLEFTSQHSSITPQLYNVTVDYTPDNEPPTWSITPEDQIINEGNSLSYDIEATDNIAIDTYFLNITTPFIINQSGTISNITNLSIATYNINISVNDTSNNILSKAISIIVLAVDFSPPVLSNIEAVSITQTEATINWTTDELSNSTVYYGISQSTTQISSNKTLVRGHSIKLSDLTISTLYYYNASSCDNFNNCNTSIQYTFTTASGGGGSPGGGGGGGGSSRQRAQPNEIEQRSPPVFNIIPEGAEEESKEESFIEEQPEEQGGDVGLLQGILERLKRAASITGGFITNVGAIGGSNVIVTVLVLLALLVFGVYEERKYLKKKKKISSKKTKLPRKNFIASLLGKRKNFEFKKREEVHKDLEKAGFSVKKSTKSSELVEVLQGLKKIGNIEGSCAISRDGLIIASNIPTKTGAEKFSANSALMVKSVETALKKLNKGTLNHIILNTKTRKVLATTAGNKAILVCLIKQRGNLGLMLIEIRKTANEIAKILE